MSPVDMGSRGRHGERAGLNEFDARQLKPAPISLDAPPRAVTPSAFPIAPDLTAMAKRTITKPEPEPEPATEYDAPVDRAFAQYYASLKGKFPPEVEHVIYAAFAAGYRAAGKPPIEELPGTKISRTIVAALRLFKEQVLAADPEEIRTGEWCSLTDIDALIEEWEGKD